MKIYHISVIYPWHFNNITQNDISIYIKKTHILIKSQDISIYFLWYIDLWYNDLYQNTKILRFFTIYRKIWTFSRYIVICRRYIAIYCVHFWRYIRKKYRDIVKNERNISRYIGIYRDILRYIARYRDISHDISIYPNISFKFAKFAVTNSQFRWIFCY